MKAVDNKQSIVYLNSQIKFRDTLITLNGFKSGHNKVFMSSLGNPYYSYKQITTPLNSDSSYKFQIVSVDNLDNQSLAVEGTIPIPEFRLPPRFITYTYLSSHAVRISWRVPADGEPDYYVVYTNNGSGEMDHDHHYQLVSGNLNYVDLNLSNNTTWLIKIESLKNGIESRSKFMVEVLTPADSVPPPSPFSVQYNETVFVDGNTGDTINSSGNGPDDETGEELVTGTETDDRLTTLVPSSYNGVTSKNVNTGKIRFQFLWIYGSLADKFRLYHDNATGTIDYSTYLEFDRINSIIQDFTTGQIYFGFNDKEYRFVVRAVNSFGIEDTNTVQHRVLLDGIPPDEVEELTIGVDI